MTRTTLQCTCSLGQRPISPLPVPRFMHIGAGKRAIGARGIGFESAGCEVSLGVVRHCIAAGRSAGGWARNSLSLRHSFQPRQDCRPFVSSLLGCSSCAAACLSVHILDRCVFVRVLVRVRSRVRFRARVRVYDTFLGCSPPPASPVSCFASYLGGVYQA